MRLIYKNKNIIMSLRQQFEAILEDYRSTFINRYFNNDEDNPVSSYWVAGNVGGVLCVQDDMFCSGSDIRFCVDERVDWIDLNNWYAYCLRLGMIDSDITCPSLEDWVNGCPRYSKEDIDDLVILAGNVRKAEEELKLAIKNMEKRS